MSVEICFCIHFSGLVLVESYLPEVPVNSRYYRKSFACDVANVIISFSKLVAVTLSACKGKSNGDR